MSSFLHPGLGFTPGLFKSSGVAEDPDAAALFSAIEGDGHALWNPEKAMINSLAISLKAEGLWDLIMLLWVPIGPTVDAAMRTLKHPQGVGTKMTNSGFLAEDWNRLQGLGDLAPEHGKFIATGATALECSPNALNTHISLVAENAFTSPDFQRDLGTINSGGFQFLLRLSSGLGAYLRLGGGGGGNTAVENASGSPSPPLGTFVSRQDGINPEVFLDGSPLSGGSRYTPALGNNPDSEIYIFRASNSGASFNKSASRIFSFASVGLSLSDAQVASYNTILSQLKTQRSQLVS